MEYFHLKVFKNPYLYEPLAFLITSIVLNKIWNYFFCDKGNLYFKRFAVILKYK
jgi:hypothetical protein